MDAGGPSFVSAAADSASALSQATVGLVTKEEFIHYCQEKDNVLSTFTCLPYYCNNFK